MPLYGLQRVSDGKLLGYPVTQKHKFAVTWANFDDDKHHKTPFIPYLWPKIDSAQRALRLWKLGGWVRGSPKKKKSLLYDDSEYGGTYATHKPERDEMEVQVVEVEFNVIGVALLEQADPSEPKEFSALS